MSRRPASSTMKATVGLSLAALCAGGLMASRNHSFRRLGSFRDKVIVITGGARGLGLELARLWCRERARVAICARSRPEVNRAVAELQRSGARVFGQPCDVTDENDVREFINSVIDEFGTVDVLVNNAGIIQVGPERCMTLDDYRSAMDTHFWGPLLMIQAVLPEMRRRGRGSIVNISSIGGKISVPHLLPYSASKFALVGLSEGLHHELAAEGINVTTVCPGLMRTGSARNALFKGRYRGEYAWFSIGSSLPGATMNSQRAAGQIIEACRRGDAEAILSLPAQVAARVHGLFPGFSSLLLSLVNRLLPAARGGVGVRNQAGYRSFSRWSPSWLTTLGDRAARRNNEL